MGKESELRERIGKGIPLIFKLAVIIFLAIGAALLDIRQTSFAKSLEKEIQRIHPELQLENMDFDSKNSVSYMTFAVSLGEMPRNEIDRYREPLESDIKKSFCGELKKSKDDLKFQLFNINVREKATEGRGFILASSILPSTCS